MISLKGTYYIDELNQLLVKLVGDTVLTNFYENNNSFELDQFTKYIDFDSVPPLLKVAWNIINRGEKTRASLKLATYLLEKHFPNHNAFNYAKPEIKAQLDLNKDLNSSDLVNLLDNFGYLEENQVSDFGESIYSIFKCLKKTIKYAQLQKTMLLVLMANPAETIFEIEGISKEETNLLQEDLNELFEALNNLSTKEETKIPLLKINGLNNLVTIALERSTHNAILLTGLVKKQNQLQILMF